MNSNTNTRLRISLLFILHFFGLLACNIESLQPLFYMGTPYHLILITALLLFDSSIWERTLVAYLGVVFLIGMAVEIVGVNTGLLFGNYHYTPALGVQLGGVPILIGITWASTAYACNILASMWFSKPVIKVVAAACFMVLFDVVLEQFATAVPLWQWHGGIIPLYNYVCWFLVGLFISYFFDYLKINHPNTVAPYFLLSQIIFFAGYLVLITPTH